MHLILIRENDATLRSRFFPQDALGDGPAFWIFFRMHG